VDKRLFLVVWHDAQGGGNTGWRPVGELGEIREVKVWSTGVILHEDQKRLVICPHFILDKSGNPVEGDAELAIPQDWIISKRELFYDKD